MLQRFIDNTFYLLFIFALVMGVVFYDALPFTFTDELCALALCFLYVYYVLHTKEWSVNKFFLTTMGVFCFYLVYSFYIHCNSRSAILSDFAIQLKPYLAFFTVYAFIPRLNAQMKKNLRFLALVFSGYLLMIGITLLFTEDIVKTLLHHPSRLATASTIMALLYLYCSEYTRRDKFIFLAILAVGLLSQRSKAYGFFVIALFVVCYVNDKFRLEFNLKNVIVLTIALAAMTVVAWDKINFYFIQGGFSNEGTPNDMYARMALYYFSTEVFTEYFPFGSGFATYATYTSGQHYSHIYADYHMNIMYGLTKDNPMFISDTYYPALAQFGVVGVVLFFLFWIILTKKAMVLFRRDGNQLAFVTSLLIIGFFLIECTSDATITHNRGLFMMMLLALSLRNTNQPPIHIKTTRQ